MTNIYAYTMIASSLETSLTWNWHVCPKTRSIINIIILSIVCVWTHTLKECCFS